MKMNGSKVETNLRKAFFLKEKYANITTAWCSLEKSTNEPSIV